MYLFSRHDFYTIIDLPEGVHEYKYRVDGEWVCDCKQVRLVVAYSSKI